MPAQLEAELDAPRTFRYEKPVATGERQTVRLARTRWGNMNIQVFTHGGEYDLHQHPHSDGFWFVLSGKLRFYTTDDEILFEIGANEGAVMPRGTSYWFESIPTEDGADVQVMRAGAVDEPLTTDGKAGRQNAG